MVLRRETKIEVTSFVLSLEILGQDRAVNPGEWHQGAEFGLRFKVEVQGVVPRMVSSGSLEERWPRNLDGT